MYPVNFLGVGYGMTDENTFVMIALIRLIKYHSAYVLTLTQCVLQAFDRVGDFKGIQRKSLDTNCWKEVRSAVRQETTRYYDFAQFLRLTTQ